MPASTVALPNPFLFACLVTVQGGTVTVIAVDAVTVGTLAGVFVVPAASSITITYSVVPTWKWFGLA